MLILQVPFNPKDWTIALPVSLVALGFLLYMVVWTAKQFGTIRGTDKPPDQSNGVGLSAKQELQVRLLIEDLVIKTSDKGGLHWAKNKITGMLWALKDRFDIDILDK